MTDKINSKTSSISCNIHPGNEADAIRVERVRPHDGIRETYFRLKFGEACVYLTDEQADEVIKLLGAR